MVKPIQTNVPVPNTKLPSDAPANGGRLRATAAPIGPQAGFSPAPAATSAGVSVAVRQAQERQVNSYRTVENDLNEASRCLAGFRASVNSPNPNFALLAEARTHLDAAGTHYREAFPSSSGTIMIRDGSNISTYDLGNLNTRLNAAELSYRRSNQLADSMR